ncbi:hypothetical protein BOX15_Mlig017876g2 [Macrostomum lignano]|uniref:Trichohyalin-plectin-homology domain-containing protein n=2 Tax=Macrostomum lignano TaxID=282301 RepID=A0A267FZU5_9PLAT|nr:hypothetical protein BOX15_Mlig017876g1 [Macrostomum lignano]PAA79263.1 hypothetical protein BOX15_Mlig017876g2 [Macrostomum lignano]
MASATIQHGRRSGQKRGEQAAPQREFVVGGGQTDLRNVTVLTGEDWSRITRQLHRREIEEQAAKQARDERANLKVRSRELIKDWDNTLLGARQKKLDERNRRLAKEEEEKKALDVEEARLAAEHRKEILEKAKIQQYYQTDRVKNFHSALRLTEVLKEREAQIELNRLRARANEGQDQKYLEIWRKEHEDAIRRDQDEAAERIRKRQECATYQREQIRLHQEQHGREAQLEDEEGLELRRLAVANALEKKRLDQIAKQEQRELMHDNLKQIADVRRMKDVQRLFDEEEDEDCRVFAAAKKKMMRLRAEKEREIHEEKQRNLNRIKERLAAELAAKRSDEEERLYNAVQEREEKLASEEDSKRRQRQTMQESIKQHREDQSRRLAAEAAEQKQRDMEMVRARREADELFQQRERQRAQEKLAEERRRADLLASQARNRETEAQKAKQAELEYEAANLQLLEQEEEQFQSYATKVIDHCERGGRNTLPLRKAAKAGAGGGLGPQLPGRGGIRPSYQTADKRGIQLPNFRRNSAAQVKAGQTGPDSVSGTQKNLGMVW